MEFNIGDVVKRQDKHMYEHDCSAEWSDYHGRGEYTVAEVYCGGGHIKVEGDNERWWNMCKFDLVSSANSILKKTMRKRIYRVLIVDKKSGKTTKDEAVVAETEQQAILKSFGVDSENTFIRVSEVGDFEEEKPITAVIVKEPKA